MSIFDPAGDPEKMPYGLAVGNHDQTGGSAGALGDGGATTQLFNQTFPTSRFQGRSYWGGSFESGVTDNSYQLFSASGMDFIIFHLENDTLSSSPLRDAVLAWVDGLMQTYSNRRAIVSIHYCVQPNGNFATHGQAAYDVLKYNSNWFLMLGGHLNEAARRTDPVGPTLS